MEVRKLVSQLDSSDLTRDPYMTTPEHCNLQMVVSNFILVLKKQHVSNGKMYLLRSPKDVLPGEWKENIGDPKKQKSKAKKRKKRKTREKTENPQRNKNKSEGVGKRAGPDVREPFESGQTRLSLAQALFSASFVVWDRWFGR